MSRNPPQTQNTTRLHGAIKYHTKVWDRGVQKGWKRSQTPRKKWWSQYLNESQCWCQGTHSRKNSDHHNLDNWQRRLQFKNNKIFTNNIQIQFKKKIKTYGETACLDNRCKRNCSNSCHKRKLHLGDFDIAKKKCQSRSSCKKKRQQWQIYEKPTSEDSL